MSSIYADIERKFNEKLREIIHSEDRDKQIERVIPTLNTIWETIVNNNCTAIESFLVMHLTKLRILQKSQEEILQRVANRTGDEDGTEKRC